MIYYKKIVLLSFVLFLFPRFVNAWLEWHHLHFVSNNEVCYISVALNIFLRQYFVHDFTHSTLVNNFNIAIDQAL